MALDGLRRDGIGTQGYKRSKDFWWQGDSRVGGRFRTSTNTGRRPMQRTRCWRIAQVHRTSLRLLAREVYDRIVRPKGPSVVALVTGENGFVPRATQYWVLARRGDARRLGRCIVAGR